VNVSSLPIGHRIGLALRSGLVSGGIALLAAVVFVHTANDQNAALVATLVEYFLPAALIVTLLVAVGSFFGALRRWFFALPLGIVAGLIASLLGTVITVASRGVLSPEYFGVIVGTIPGVNLPFFVAAVLATAIVAPVVWHLPSGFDFLGRRSGERVAIVRLPASNLAEGLVTHGTRKKVNTELADDQWDAYVDALEANGWRIVEVEPATDLADSVFVEDTVVVLGGTAILASPGAESRRAEVAGTEKTMRQLGLSIEQITLPGTLDGGDVLTVGTTVYVGRGGRTNAEGIRQLRVIAARLGFTVVAVPVSKVLHLKSAVTALPDGTVIGYAKVVDDASMFDRFLPVPEEAGSHVVVLSADTVLMAASAPGSADLIRELGYTVITVDISEFEKLEGCVTCLSVLVR
jgi:dimethylargininase